VRHLYLIRHAKSSWRDPHLQDIDRPLNKRGIRDAPMMGERLRKAGICPDLMLVSPAVRARATANAIAGAIGYRQSLVVIVEDLYSFAMEGIVSVLHGVDDTVQSVALVGHNHGMTSAAEWFTGESLGNVPTCGIVAIDTMVDQWRLMSAGDGILRFFDYPKRTL
jgi:phosphohistidine phosphatase